MKSWKKSRSDPKSYLESDKDGSTVIQSREYRISMAKPPFSEAFEITAVRPVANVSLDEYNISEKLMERISKKVLKEYLFQVLQELEKVHLFRH